MAFPFDEDANLDLWKLAKKARPWDGKYIAFRKYHQYPLLKRMRKDPMTCDNGTAIEWHNRIGDAGTAAFVGALDAITYRGTDVMGQFTAPWTLLHGYYMVTDDEIQECRGKASLYNLREIKKTAAIDDMADVLERQMMIPRTGTTEDKAKMVLGLPYSVVPITGAQVTTRAAILAAGTDASGFFGGMNPLEDAADVGTCYGVDSSNAKYARYRNYVDYWDDNTIVFSEDRIDQVLRMLRQLRWQGPISAKEFESGSYDNLCLYTTDRMLAAAERKARANNDSLGADLGKFMGQVVTRGVPWVWSEPLQDNTGSTNPVLAIDHDVLQPVIFSGENFREQEPKRLEAQPRVIAGDVWLKMQITNRARNRCGRIDYVAAA